MRLLHCERSPQDDHIAISFKGYDGDSIPEYAILSHRWGPESNEVSFDDIKSGSAESKQGYAKIQGCCAQALDDDFQYVWIDSCCIDKSSSAELSEAINSMYRYYADSAVCYAYLEDVHDKEDPRRSRSTFRESVWFFRGWTLQELIAPKAVFFLSKSWIELGTKATLDDVIQEITGIEKKYLTGHPVSDANIAKRMSWAANRTTTRVEDRAYSLMGLFDVHMPTMYGEGGKAFVRLQLEILKESNDHTIFAWDDSGRERCGMLAEHPRLFRKGYVIERLEPRERGESSLEKSGRKKSTPHYELTNFGLHIWLPVEHGFSIRETGDSVIRAALDCSDTSSSSPHDPVLITLLPIKGRSVFLSYERVGSSVELESKAHASKEVEDEELFITQHPVSQGVWSRLWGKGPFYQRLEVDFHNLQGFGLSDYFPRESSKLESTLILPGARGQGYVIEFWNESTKENIVLFGKFQERKVWLDMFAFTSDGPPKAQALHQRYYKNTSSNHRSFGVLWFKKYLPVSRKHVILSAKEMEYRPWPWEYRGSGEKLRITLRIAGETRNKLIQGNRSRL